ncbi:hypothetical protein GCM10027456_70790 [Kineosporia babensis]
MQPSLRPQPVAPQLPAQQPSQAEPVITPGDLDLAVAKERQRLVQLQQELQHLVKIRLPAALAGTEVPPAEQPQELSPETVSLLDEMLGQVSGTVQDRDESRRLALVELASRVQTSAHRIQQAMSGLAEQHPGDPDLLETTMRVDHAATQQARHAQSVKVLCDEWPGQQWPAPLALVDVVRAASGRIVAFSRVQVTGDQTVAGMPGVVEPLIHLIAELLANATEYSAPTTPVSVAVRGVQRGAVIEIDDSGFGLDDYRLAEAREIVSGRRLLGVSDVGEIPQTGFAVVGRFARRHGLTVDLGISPYGGVRAVVLVPTHLVVTVALPAPAAIERPDPESTPPAGIRLPDVVDTRIAPTSDPTPVVESAPMPKRSPMREGKAASRCPGQADDSETKLPQRRSARKQDQITPFRSDLDGRPRPAVTPTAPTTAPDDAGDWMERFFEGSQPIPVNPVAEPSTDTPSTGAALSSEHANDTDLEGRPSLSTERKDAAEG